MFQAAANHERIVESIEEALDDLSDDLPFWVKQMEVHQGNANMERYITLLYVVIFKFLCDIMTTWCHSGWQRTLQSFNSNFISKRIQEARDDMKRLAEKLQREANHATQGQISKLPDTEYFDRKIEELHRVLGEDAARMLERQQALVDYVTQLMRQPSPQPQGSRSLDAAEVEPSEDYSSNSLDSLFKYLVRFSGPQERRLDILVERSLDMHIDSEVMQRIQGWFKEPKSKTMWICGAFPTPLPSRNTVIGAYITRLARKAGIPVLAHFCRYSIESSDESGVEPREKELVHVIYSLLFQVLHALQQISGTNLSHIVQRSEKLDESEDSLPEAIALLEESIEAGPGLVFCIIDGIQELAERQGHNTSFRMLLEVLCRDSDRHRGSAQIVKTLFTTNGFAPVLAHLHPDERLDLSDVVGQNGADFGPGYNSMAFLAL